MKSSFRIISTFLIIVLTGLLVGIMYYYYNNPIQVNTKINEYVSSGEKIFTNQYPPKTNEIIDSGEAVVHHNSGSTEIIDSSETIINESGEINSKQEVMPEAPTVKPEEHIVKNEDNNKDDKKVGDKTGVIISSEDSMTNKEKREILTELDNTLMELLDVVDKVQTVDETRLITDESEVRE